VKPFEVGGITAQLPPFHLEEAAIENENFVCLFAVLDWIGLVRVVLNLLKCDSIFFLLLLEDG
jgi:hypothetical protein